ncbi:MAG: 2-oxoacid:acceptor oxidoreductase subunit alpha [bacterium]
MKAKPNGVLTGSHYLDGDHACAEGALAAGCRFFAGYPITPSTEVAERIVARFPMVGGIFIQVEDELGAMAAVLGAAWAGKKSMTVTSGPGFSLMMENLGLGTMMEVPCVLVNVQRGGPSTGLPTMVGQADMMQARWGSHGDYEIIALCPASPQEAFDYTIKAFNLSEKYRVPTLLMMDECVGHMTEKVVIPSAEEINIFPRRLSKLPPDEYLPYVPGKDLVPDMITAGEGYKIHTTGLTHDERGYPVMSPEVQNELVKRLMDKINKNADVIIEIEEENTDDADVIVMAYGITARVTQPAIAKARENGIKVGFIKMITVWPFPEKRVKQLAEKVKAFVMPEINMGQMVLELERVVGGRAKTFHVPHAGGWVHEPDDIYKVIEEAVK